MMHMFTENTIKQLALVLLCIVVRILNDSPCAYACILHFNHRIIEEEQIQPHFCPLYHRIYNVAQLCTQINGQPSATLLKIKFLSYIPAHSSGNPSLHCPHTQHKELLVQS